MDNKAYLCFQDGKVIEVEGAKVKVKVKRKPPKIVVVWGDIKR